MALDQYYVVVHSFEDFKQFSNPVIRISKIATVNGIQVDFKSPEIDPIENKSSFTGYVVEVRKESTGKKLSVFFVDDCFKFQQGNMSMVFNTNFEDCVDYLGDIFESYMVGITQCKITFIQTKDTVYP